MERQLQEQRNGMELHQFTPEFIEKHKHNPAFTSVVEKLTTGTNPYLLIQYLIEELAKEREPFEMDMEKYHQLEQKYMFGKGE